MRELKGDWRDLFNGFMVALDLRKMFFGLCGIFLTVFLLGGGSILIAGDIDLPNDLVPHHWWGAQCQAWHHTFQSSPIVYIPYSIVFVIIFVLIWAYFGGAISRAAAYEIAKDGERLEMRRASGFARKKYASLFWAPLICALGFIFFAGCNFLGGLIGKLADWIPVVGFGAPVIAILLPLALLAGFIMVLIAVGTSAGLPLFAPAVAAEGTDSFDAVSRGFSYIYTRPWHYLWYQFVTLAYGYVCITFVILFAITLCHFGIMAGGMGFELFWPPDNPDASGEFESISNVSWSVILSQAHAAEPNGYMNYAWDPVSIASAPHPYGRIQWLCNRIVDVDYSKGITDLCAGHQIAAVVITFWLVLTLGLSLGYVVSYFFSQQTMIYLLLRKRVDGIEMNEIFEEAEEEAGEPEPAPPSEPPAPPVGESKPAPEPAKEIKPTTRTKPSRRTTRSTKRKRS
jgi:hypothetical protein